MWRAMGLVSCLFLVGAGSGCGEEVTCRGQPDAGAGDAETAWDAGPVDDQAPVLDEIEPIPAITSDVTPLYRFFSSEPGRVLYRGPCRGDLEEARGGENAVHLGPLADGTYTDCALAVEDAAGNRSQWLGIRAFTVDTHPPDPPVVLEPFARTGAEPVRVLLGGEANTEILADGASAGTVGPDGRGWALLSGLADGEHQVSFQLRDAAGNVSLPTEFAFVKYSHLAACEADGLADELRLAWSDLRDYLASAVAGSADRPYNLYNVQLWTAPLLRYAVRNGDTQLVDELASLYAGAADTLTVTDQYLFYYFPEPSSPRTSIHTLDRAYPMWVDPNSGAESTLVSSQFLYAVSLLVRHVAGLPPGARSQALQDLVDRFGTVLADHYRRWVLGVTVDGGLPARGPFQVRGWGCRVAGVYVETGMNHRRLTELRLAWQLGDDSSPAYCNAVTDTDLWIYAGVGNLLAAAAADPSVTDLTAGERDALLLYLRTATDLLASRAVYRTCRDFDGNETECADFDEGLWDDHPDYAYTGYTGASFPTAADQARASGVGWDVSHARRFVEVFESLREVSGILGLAFPDERFLAGLARSVAHVIFLGDLALPLFTNFFDGTNGWYRVGYSGRTGFGYGPSDGSVALLTGGYALWIEYYLPLKAVYEAVDDMLTSADPTVEAHRQAHYETCYYNNYERRTCFDLSDPSSRSTQLFWLQYLAGICF